MSAKEMFKKLDYYSSYDYETAKVEFAFYHKHSDKMIIFNVKDKTIEVFEGALTLDELRAINRQVEELKEKGRW